MQSTAYDAAPAGHGRPYEKPANAEGPSTESLIDVGARLRTWAGFKHLAAGDLELRQQVLARLVELGDLLVEVLGVGGQRGDLDPRLPELGDRLPELRLVLPGRGIALGVARLPIGHRT